jgi:hypothetical protein
MKKQVLLKITNFQDGLNCSGEEWQIEKRLYDALQQEILHAATASGQTVQFSIEGPAQSGWSFEAKVNETKNFFQLATIGKQKHFDRVQAERLAKEAAEIEEYSFITIGNKSAVVSKIHSDGSFQIVYEQSPGKHIAEDAKFDGEKYVFCVSGPCGAYADNHAHYAPFISALKRRYK